MRSNHISYWAVSWGGEWGWEGFKDDCRIFALSYEGQVSFIQSPDEAEFG